MVAAIAAALALAGCPGPDPGPDAAPQPTPSPIPGGRVVFGVVGGPPTLDPYSPVATDLTRALIRPLYPSLFRFGPDGEVVPDLASDFDITGFAAHVELAQRRWSNGRRITPADVVASVRRARPPSGFAGLRARVQGRTHVVFEGRKHNWKKTLATSTYVLPGGRSRPRAVTSGPFELVRFVPGMKLDLARSTTWEGEPAYLNRIRVFFLETLDIAIELMERDRLDAAALPSSVNLDERLDEIGLAHAEALGWESVRVEFNRATLTQDQWVGAAQRIDITAMERGFVRDDGRVANTLYPGPDVWDGPYSHLSVPGEKPDELRLAAPAGDELLGLMQRAMQIHLGRADIDTEVVTVPADRLYGEWRDSSPFDAALLRVAGAPGLTDARAIASRTFARPLFHVETLLAWHYGIGGLVPNPTLEGPLWNAEGWFRNTGQI